jgi:hypothetical protein
MVIMIFIKHHILKALTLLTLIISTSFSSFSQEAKKITPYLTVQYSKDTDNQRVLQTTLTYSMNRMEIPLPGMEVSISVGSQSEKHLAAILTDEKGIARYKLDDNLTLPVNKEGFWDFSTGYSGNDSIESISSELSVKDVDLEMVLSEIDSLKTINLTAFTSENGKKKPVSDETVTIFVPRMFSILPVGDVYLDKNGTANFEFPSDIPGDNEGNLTIIARFDDNPTFGNVEKSTVQKWGLPRDNYTPGSHRALWTKSPPMWMIITLSILLMGVWGHYFFAIISLIRIKIEAKREKQRMNIGYE